MADVVTLMKGLTLSLTANECTLDVQFRQLAGHGELEVWRRGEEATLVD